MINNSMDEGTQLPYIRHALDRGYGVVVLNTNDNKPGVEVAVSLTLIQRDHYFPCVVHLLLYL